MAYKNSIITGITDLLVLLILKEKGDSYVYEICKYITENSNELLSIPHNTVQSIKKGCVLMVLCAKMHA